MRLTQNVILIMLVCVLLFTILSLEGLNMLSFSAIKRQSIYNFNNTNNSFVTSNYEKPKSSRANIEIIWDISQPKGDGINKLSTSRKLLKKIIKDLPTRINLGISVYGVNSQNKTSAYYTIPICKNNQVEILETVSNINPTGEVSINENLLKAREKLHRKEGKKHILLITDGEDTGKALPERSVVELSQAGIKTHVIHVGKINKLNQLRLKTLAELGNGKYFTYLEEEKIVPTINLN